MHRRHILSTLALAALLIATRSAHAGPTVSADLDLGTSTHGGEGGPAPSLLYAIGFALRAGWRFDIAQVWFLPEIGGGYAVERFITEPTATPRMNPHVSRVFGGGRIGWSGVLAPGLRIEPAIYGHAGCGFYHPDVNGTAFDVGLALDLRILKHLMIGAHAGYDVVTVWHYTPGPKSPPGSLQPAALPPIADASVRYGLHAGVLFW